MGETKIENVEFVHSKNARKTFKAKCFHCKEKEKVTTDNGIEVDLPYAYVNIPKYKDMMKQFKSYVKESKEKYGNERVIKRTLLDYCPKCGHTINVCCKDYVDFYTPKKKETKKEEKIEE